MESEQAQAEEIMRSVESMAPSSAWTDRKKRRFTKRKPRARAGIKERKKAGWEKEKKQKQKQELASIRRERRK